MAVAMGAFLVIAIGTAPAGAASAVDAGAARPGAAVPRSVWEPSTVNYPWAGELSGGLHWAATLGQCVSYTAWMIYQNLGGHQKPPAIPAGAGWFPSDGLTVSPLGEGWGNAGDWAASAITAGFAVDNTPAVGAIAQWKNNGNGGTFPIGHVAYVTAIGADGSIDLAQYNLREDSRFSTLHMPRGGATDTSNGHPPFAVGWPDNFLHVGDGNVAASPRNHIAAGDFDNNGRADLAAIDANNDLRLYTGDGAGHLSGGSLMWQSGGLWKGFHAIAAGDFMNNGKLDLVGIDANNDMRLYTGDGAGHLSGGSLMTPAGGLWKSFQAIVAGDFNNDGNLDVAGIDAFGDMRLYTGDGRGHLSGGALMWSAGGLWRGFHAIVAGDFNNDGNMDIAGIDANNDMRTYTGTGAGHLSGGSLMTPAGGLWQSFIGIASADFNGDFNGDIAGIDANGDMRLYGGDGRGHVSGGSLMWPAGGLWRGF
jgi:surface antigen